MPGIYSHSRGADFRRLRATYSVFDLNVQVESIREGTGGAGNTGKSKTKHPSVPRVPCASFFLNTRVKVAKMTVESCLLEKVSILSARWSQVQGLPVSAIQ